MVQKVWEELEDWQKGDRLDGLAATIRVKGAQHHADIASVLCAGCEAGLVYRQRNGNGSIQVICNKGSAPLVIPSDIAECSGYSAKASLTVTLEDMAKQALTIDVRALPPGKHTYL